MSLNEIFPEREQIKPGLLGRLAGKSSRHNAVVDLNNLLSRCACLLDVHVESVESIASVYKVNMQKAFSYELQWFYKTYLLHCLQDHKLQICEREELKHLKFLLGLRQAVVNEIHEEVVTSVYNESVKDVIADGEVDEQEREFLKALQEELMLPQDLAERIFNETAQMFVERKYDEAFSDERVTPEELEELRFIKKNLGVDLHEDSPRRELLTRYKLYWTIENGDLPAVDLGIPLDEDELGYMSFNTGWYEYRITEQMETDEVVPIRVKIAKEDFLKEGKSAFREVSDERMKRYDKGTLYVTSKRLIFEGGRESAFYNAGDIIDLNLYRNGIEIQVGPTECVFFENSHNAEMIAFLLGRVIRDLE